MKKHLSIAQHYESCLEQHGDTHRGVDWPNEADALTRYRVMLDVIRNPRPEGIELLDFGCGTSRLNDYIAGQNIQWIDYSGLDISSKFVEVSRRKYPKAKYFCCDILDNGCELPQFDYIVLNGVLTEKRSLSFDEMFEFMQQLLIRVFAHARIGIAFNTMSKHVDWERDDLFHVPHDALASFLIKNLTRNYVFRNDYGLYEYTTYVYK